MFRNSVARKTHSYYVVDLDGCVPGWVARRLQWDRCGSSYYGLLSVVVHGVVISYGTPVVKVMTLMSGNTYNYGTLSIII